jgi:hypothetical protein
MAREKRNYERWFREGLRNEETNTEDDTVVSTRKRRRPCQDNKSRLWTVTAQFKTIFYFKKFCHKRI